MPVRIDPLIVEELADMDLVLWEAKHPKRDVWNEEKQKYTSREDKNWVTICITGPGLTVDAVAGAPTLRKAVDAALRTFLADRVPGLRGAMLRLEREMFGLALHISAHRYTSNLEDEDGDIPF